MNSDPLLLGAVILLAAFVQGVIGFAFGMVLMSVLPRFLPVPAAVATTATCGLLVSGLVFWRYRRHVLWREVGPQLLGAALGLPLGVLALKHLDADLSVRILGGSLVLYVLGSVWPRRGGTEETRPVTRAWAAPAGFVGGALGGAFATGGPPVIAYASARRLTPAAFKAVLQAYFFTATCAHVALLAQNDILTGALLGDVLPFLVLIPAGVWLGGHAGERVNPRIFRRLVLGALLALGVAYAVMGR